MDGFYGVILWWLPSCMRKKEEMEFVGGALHFSTSYSKLFMPGSQRDVCTSGTLLTDGSMG